MNLELNIAFFKKELILLFNLTYVVCIQRNLK